ncbi:serine hydrolase [Streptomyces sp. NPDC047981]|uniref:D-alanyl-D-alanine carboxypeptidase n=1 Tax=Streptomyces sp. NPDC047981 TaxID=3154610 RepID=UPI0034408B2C
MTHGGGTVAGESPDKAEQQESSKETTPGGGGRDPRLSVLREPAPSPVQVDQPTAVFKTLAPRTPEDDAPAEERVEPVESRVESPVESRVESPVEERVGERVEESETEPEAPSEEASEADASEGGDRLKAAVAAWVASGDEERASEPADEPSEPSEPAEAAEPADVSTDEREAEDEPQAAESAPVAPEAVEAVEAVEEAEEAEEAPVDAAPARDSADSWFAARKPAAATEEESQEEPAPTSEPEAEAAVEAEADEAKPAPAPEPVDQPTTVFKAVRPPVVDQPTTALKLPPTPPTPKTPSAPSAPSAPSGTAPAPERPSTFVPLRPDTPMTPGTPAKASPAQGPAPAAASAAPAPVPPSASLAEAERTRQQPMPPLPPLDLLAELTNTPPPAPTPMRTTLRRVRIWTPLVVLLLIVFAVVQFVRPLPPPKLSLTAAPTFTFEGGELQMPWPTEGQGAAEVEGVGSLGTYGAQKPAPLASVAKTMTAYVILRDHPIKGKETGPEITIDKKAADEAGAEFESTAAVREGQTYTQKELLQLLMIPSANNVARLLGRWDAGSEAAFVEKMNAAAKDLGMTQSTYTDPSGLNATTVSTPQDQLKLAKAVMQYDVFRGIVDMPNLTVDGIPGRIENNNNILLEPGVSGIKTGSSTPAGGNLLWSAKTIVDGKERRILGIVMGAKDAAVLHEKLQLSIDYSLKLIQQAQKDVTSASVIRKGQVVGHIDDGLGGLTPVVADKELKAVGWPGLKVDLELTDGGKAVPHTGKKGDVVGQVSIGTGAGKVSSPVSLQTDLVEPGIDKKLTRLG